MGFQNGKFAKLYVWFAKVKEAMGLLFIAYVFFYLLLGIFAEPGFQRLDLFTAIQMAFAGFFIGMVRQAAIPSGILSKPRGTLFMLSGEVITVGFSLIFGWFENFPLWCALVFWGLMTAGYAAMILEYYFELHQQTALLNKKLEQFQSAKDAERTAYAER